jgi:HSP20 family protein
VEVLTPGYEPETLDVNVLGRQLTVSGERNAPASEDGESVHRSERSFGKFSRTIQLPANVKEDEISAEYKYGVLTISLPKAEEAKPRRINVAS